MDELNLIFALLPVLLIALGFWVGHSRERRHIESLDAREVDMRDMIVTDLKTVSDPDNVTGASLVMGEAVIATDYFKSFASQLRNLVGGEVRTLETLARRARREAMLRMLEQARQMGATEVHNVRLETSNIRSAGGRSKAISVEMLVFGTAIIRR